MVALIAQVASLLVALVCLSMVSPWLTGAVAAGACFLAVEWMADN